MTTGVEFAEAQPKFSETVCIETAKEVHQYGAWIGIGGYWHNLPSSHAEERFLPPELVLTDQLDRIMLLPVANTLPGILDTVTPTAAELLETQAAARAVKLTFGSRLAAEAQEVADAQPEIFSTVSLAATVDRLGRAPNYGRDEDLLRTLQKNGHVILPSTETQSTLLVLAPAEKIPTEGRDQRLDGSTVVLQTIDLDLLDEARPELIADAIVEWHTAYAVEQFASHSLEHIAYHERPLEEIAPSFLLELAKIPDPQERQREIEQCHAILQRVAAIGTSERDIFQEYNELIWRFHHDKRVATKGMSHDSVYLDSMLRHLEDCPGSNGAQAVEALLVNDGRKAFLPTQAAQQETLDERDLNVLAEFGYYFSLQRDPEALENFLHKHGVRKEDLGVLDGVTARFEQDDNHTFSAYGVIASMIIMTKQSRADVFSPVQRALVDTLYQIHPYGSHGRANLQAAWQLLDANSNS